jgi:hypothetical protein
MTSQFKLYSSTYPLEKSLVNFIFTEHCKDCFNCYLTDYNVKAIMPFQLATLRTSLKKNVNTLAPLNKPLVGTIEEIIDDTIIISMAYIDKESIEYKTFEEDTIKNKRLIASVKQYTTKNHMNFNKYWEEKIYPLDILREEKSLFDYINENLDKYNDDKYFDESLILSLKQIIIKNKNPVTKFKMISQSGIDSIKKIINQTFEITKKYTDLYIILESTPNYIISSKNPEIQEKDHIEFLKVLEKLGKNPENLVYIKQ